MKQNILLVDDDEAVCNAVSRFLNCHGYKIFTASNAKQALQVAAETELTLLILDIGLNDENGLELLDVFKATHPRLPVIMWSGMGYQEDLLQAAREKGADCYTSKALVIDQLLMDIHRVLRHRNAGFQSAALPSNA